MSRGHRKSGFYHRGPQVNQYAAALARKEYKEPQTKKSYDDLLEENRELRRENRELRKLLTQ